MHDTAAAFGAAFFRSYTDAIERARVLEIGAADLNGALRGSAPLGAQYTGIDLAPGPGVDRVLDDPYRYPFNTASFDVVVSSSCFEHDPMFWRSFTEMCRVVRPGGFIYLNAPSNGPVHRVPTDNWRFYPDAGVALATWARHTGQDTRLVESFVGRRVSDLWNDCVMVFGKGETRPPQRLLAELFPRSFNIRIGEVDAISNECGPTEDMTLQVAPAEPAATSPAPNGGDARAVSESAAAAAAQIDALRAALAERDATLARVGQILADRQAEIAALHAALTRTTAVAAE
jgi:SAM-dependent methyltransferase